MKNERLTKKTDSGMVYFIDRENDNMRLEPCEMDSHHSRLAIGKLAEYEDLEEQGLLLRLPCKVNQDIYFVPSETNFKLNILNNMAENNRVYHQRICHIVYDGNGYYLECDKELEFGTGRVFIDRHYGEIWFLSQAEAEEKLRELEGK